MRNQVSAAILTALSACSARAWGDEAATFGGNVQFMSNYVARGFSQSQGQPAEKGEIDFNPDSPGFYADLAGGSINWIDQLYPGDSVDLEVDGCIGDRTSYGLDWATKIGVVRIQFAGHYVPQTPPVDQPNSTELFGSVAWKGLKAQLNYALTNYVATPDSRGTTYLDLSASQAAGESWTLDVHIGRTYLTGTDPGNGERNRLNDRTDYKLSATYALGSGVSLTLAHTWVNGDPARFTLDGYHLGGHHTWLLLEKDF
jgi:uncharacterized protein (TIGR02001 family)